jgi:glutamate 5-kinase
MKDRSVVVVKIGSSSVTTADGSVNQPALTKLCGEVKDLRESGKKVVVVTSGAIASGLPLLGLGGERQPRDRSVLRAASAVGQISLMRSFETALADVGLTGGQILLAPTDFMNRRRYLMSRGTIEALLALGVVPVVNENDAITDEEIRFGDNDRLAALVAHLIDAERLVLLTDTAGIFTSDPRRSADASLISEVVEIDDKLEAAAGGSASNHSRGGMASKLAAAKIAAWSGVEVVIAAADRENVVADACDSVVGVGTVFRAREARFPARKLWIAFAVQPEGQIVVDAGARKALEDNQKSLLAAGIVDVQGTFGPEDAVEVVDQEGNTFARALVRWSSETIRDNMGAQSAQLPSDVAPEVIHRDDLVILP